MPYSQVVQRTLEQNQGRQAARLREFLTAALASMRNLEDLLMADRSGNGDWAAACLFLTQNVCDTLQIGRAVLLDTSIQEQRHAEARARARLALLSLRAGAGPRAAAGDDAAVAAVVVDDDGGEEEDGDVSACGLVRTVSVRRRAAALDAGGLVECAAAGARDDGAGGSFDGRGNGIQLIRTLRRLVQESRSSLLADYAGYEYVKRARQSRQKTERKLKERKSRERWHAKDRLPFQSTQSTLSIELRAEDICPTNRLVHPDI